MCYGDSAGIEFRNKAVRGQQWRETGHRISKLKVGTTGAGQENIKTLK